MTRDTVFVLTHSRDRHSDLVIDALTQRGVPVIRFHTEDYPQRATIACSLSNEGGRQLLTCNDAEHDLDRVRSVWNRRPRLPHVSDDLNETDRAFASEECTHFLRALWALLDDRFWVNAPDRSRQGSLKPAQLAIARELGFEIPRTLMTNRPDEVESFVAACEGDVVYKTFTPYARLDEDGHPVAVYTRRLTGANRERLNGLRFAPGIFQEYVPKRVELRVTVIGAHVFAVEIHSQQSERSRDDWRRYDLANTPYYGHTLPADVERRCEQLVRRLGLVTGCIDMILTPDGRYVFLEINPDGQWAWLERLAGVPLLDHFVEMLAQGTPDYAPPAVPEAMTH